MKKPNRFRVNTPSVIHEMIDGETILVNLEKGHYYSLLNTGSDIFEYVIKGMSEPEIVTQLSAQYQGNRNEIEKAVQNLILELQTEEILIHDMAQDSVDQNSGGRFESNGNPINEVFKAPILEKYTDMEDLLLLDPIHEVDETGWPNLAPVASEEGK